MLLLQFLFVSKETRYPDEWNNKVSDELEVRAKEAGRKNYMRGSQEKPARLGDWHASHDHSEPCEPLPSNGMHNTSFLKAWTCGSFSYANTQSCLLPPVRAWGEYLTRISEIAHDEKHSKLIFKGLKPLLARSVCFQPGFLRGNTLDGYAGWKGSRFPLWRIRVPALHICKGNPF